MMNKKTTFKHLVLVVLLLTAACSDKEQDQPVSSEQKTASASKQPDRDKPLPPPAFVKNRLLAKPDKNRDPAMVKTLYARTGTTVVKEFSAIGLQVLKLRKDARVLDIVDDYRESGLFEYVEPDYYMYANPFYPDDPLFSGQWSLDNNGQPGAGPFDVAAGLADADIDAPEAWDVQIDGNDIIVAVLDSGIRYTHEDLQTNMWRNPGETGLDDNGQDRSTNSIDDDGNGFVDDVYGARLGPDDAVSGDPMDDDSHGTHVAGTIGAATNNGTGMAGVASNIQLMALKFLHPVCEPLFGNELITCGETSHGIELFLYAVHHGAKVVNASIGSAVASQGWRDALDYAKNYDVIVAAAAGNGSFDASGDNNDLPGSSISLNPPNYPSTYANGNLVSVAATNRADQLASFSNYGRDTVDLAAPGVSVLSTIADSDSSYDTKSGTSMATPHVAAALALLKARFPGEDYRVTIQRLLASVDPLPELQDKVRSGGRLNLYRALTNDTAIGFEATPVFGVAPLAVTFTNTSFGNVTDYQWDFGDGNTSTEVNPSHTYATEGLYYAKLTITTAAGTQQSLSKGILVAAQPVAATTDFVTVSDACNQPDEYIPSNASDILGYGSVPYDFEIGKHELTNAYYAAFLNIMAINSLDVTTGLYSEQMDYDEHGGIERVEQISYNLYQPKAHLADKPVVFTSRYDAMQLANWLHNKETTANGDETGFMDLWSGAYTMMHEAVAERELITRNADARYFLPSLNEAYKAAYYKAEGTNSDYWLYPVQSNQVPVNALAYSVDDEAPGAIRNPDNDPGPPDGVVNFGGQALWDDASSILTHNINLTTVATAGNDSVSAYGTFDQGGNASEWLENSVIRLGGDARSPANFLRSLPEITGANYDDFTISGRNDLSGIRLARIQDTTSMRRDSDGIVIDCEGDVGRFSQIKADADGNLHIAYYDATKRDLKYAFGQRSSTNSSYVWQIERIDTEGDVGAHLSLALDSAGRPHISYHDASNRQLKLASKVEAQWLKEVVSDSGENRDTGLYTSLALDVNDVPHISYIEWPKKTQVLGQRPDLLPPPQAGAPFSRQNPTVLNGNLQPPRGFQIAEPGKPVFMGGIVKYATQVGGNWQTEVVNAGKGLLPRANFRFTSIALTAGEKAFIVYQNMLSKELLFSEKTPFAIANNSNLWSSIIIDTSSGAGAYPSLVVPQAEDIYIAYYNENSKNLMLAQNHPTLVGIPPVRPMLIRTLDQQGDVGSFANIAFDNNGEMNIAYYFQDTAGGIKRLHAAQSEIVTEQVINNAHIKLGKFVSLTFTDNDKPAFSYYDETNGDLMFYIP